MFTNRIITNLANHHGVEYQETPADHLGDIITFLMDGELQLDDTEKKLIALTRAGVITRLQMIRLQARYLRELLRR